MLIQKSFKVMPTLVFHISPVLGQCFISLAQAMTSQAENNTHLRPNKGGVYTDHHVINT